MEEPGYRKPFGDRPTQARILLAEDNRFTRNLLGSLLRSNGYAVNACANAVSAITSLESQQPDLVISDLELGRGPSGLEVLRALRRMYAHLPAIILTGYRSPSLVDSEAVVPPAGTVYLVKADLESDRALLYAIREVLAGRDVVVSKPSADSLKSITRTQAEILRMVAAGMSNEAIAARRGTSVRAVENLVRRALQAIGVKVDRDSNARVLAATTYLTDSSLTVR